MSGWQVFRKPWCVPYYSCAYCILRELVAVRSMEWLGAFDIECSVHELAKLCIAKTFVINEFHNSVNLQLASMG